MLSLSHSSPDGDEQPECGETRAGAAHPAPDPQLPGSRPGPGVGVRGAGAAPRGPAGAVPAGGRGPQDEARQGGEAAQGKQAVHRRKSTAALSRINSVAVSWNLIHTFQPVLHDWCNKGRGMCYPVWGTVHVKEPLLLIDKSSLCVGSGFPFSLSEWSLTICLTPYNP